MKNKILLFYPLIMSTLFCIFFSTSILAQEYVQIQNRYKNNEYLHNEHGKIEVGPLGAPGWWSAMWKIIPVPGTSYVQIQSRYKNNEYLHNEHGKIEVGPLGAPGWWSAMWKIIPVPGTSYVQIQSRYKNNEYLHNEHGKIEVGPLGASGWWSAMWKIIPVEGPKSASEYLSPGSNLSPGQKLVSSNKHFSAIMQHDGNFVIYLMGNALWSTGTYGNPSSALTMQNDGNLVIYHKGNAIWQSGTFGRGPSTLMLTNDGQLIIYAKGKATWASPKPDITLKYYKKALRIVKITCHKASDNDEEDEIYLKTSDKSKLDNPVEIMANETVFVNYDIPLDKSGMANFQVMEHDNPGSPDEIGRVIYSYEPNAVAESFTDTAVRSKKITGDDGNYTVHYQLIQDRFKNITTKINPANPSFMPGGTMSVSEATPPAEWLLEYSKRWMGKLGDSTLLSQINIPGTHDSGATEDGLSLGYSECQDWTIKEQLNTGIRYFDLRGTCPNKSLVPTSLVPTKRIMLDDIDLYITHGPVRQPYTMNGILNSMVKFLKENPTEVIIINIANNGTNGIKGPLICDDATFNALKDLVLQKYSKIYRGGTKNPILKEVRGQIFILNDHKDGTNYEEENFWKIPFDKELVQKFAFIRNFKVMEKTDAKYYHQGLAGSGAHKTPTGNKPHTVSEYLNPFYYNLIGYRTKKERLGIITMDFPGEHLIYRIIQSNFDLK